MRHFKNMLTVLFILIIINPSLYSLTLDLTAALELGLKNNKQLKIAHEKVQAARADVGIARSSFFPSISGQANYTYMGIIPKMEMQAMGIVIPDMNNPMMHYHTLESYEVDMARRNNYDASVSLTQPIFMWGRLMNSYNLAKARLGSEEQNLKKAQMQTIYDVKNAFYNYLLAKKKADLLEKTYEQFKENVRSATVNFKAGIITRYDLMALEVELVNMEPSVNQAKDSIEIARDSLQNLLDYRENDLEVNDEFIYTNIIISFEMEKETLLQNNPELKSMEYIKEINSKLISIARAGNKPFLTANLNYKYTYLPEDDTTYGSSEPHSWTATLALTVPISEWFPWSKTMKDTDKTKANYEEMDISYMQLQEMMLLSLKQTILDLQTQYKLIESQKQNIQKAEQTYAFKQKEYRNGIIKNTELIDSQVALTRAETNYLESIFRYIMAKARLDLLLGHVNKEKF